jgi:hypothetical protein
MSTCYFTDPELIDEMLAQFREIITDLQADYEHLSHHVADPDGPDDGHEVKYFQAFHRYLEDDIHFQKSIAEEATV